MRSINGSKISSINVVEARCITNETFKKNVGLFICDLGYFGSREGRVDGASRQKNTVGIRADYRIWRDGIIGSKYFSRVKCNNGRKFCADKIAFDGTLNQNNGSPASVDKGVIDSGLGIVRIFLDQFNFADKHPASLAVNESANADLAASADSLAALAAFFVALKVNAKTIPCVINARN